jgi:hypothetical protein
MGWWSDVLADAIQRSGKLTILSCTGFPKRSCSNKKIERDDDSKKSHPAPEENRRTRTRRSRASPVIWPKKS